MTTECCLSCVYGVTNTRKPRECRRHAPIRGVDIRRTRKGGANIYMSTWPFVLDTDWCGDYEERII